MSDPFPFSFNLTKDRTLICHAVIFTSYELRDEDAKVDLLTEESDPRVKHFLKYLWDNFLKEKRQELDEALKKAELSTTNAEAERIGRNLAHKLKKDDQ